MKNNKPTKFILKGYAGRHISKGDPNDADRTMMYNGIPVKWFIGDINRERAKELGINVRWIGVAGQTKIEKDGPFWEAWGSCLGHAYQLFAWFNPETRELIDIHPLPRVEGQDHYFNQEIYDKLIK